MQHLEFTVRDLQDTDNLTTLTDLIHAAYAAHASAGLNYWGTHQSVADTAQRFASGQGLIAENPSGYLGTAILRPPTPASDVPLYRRSWSLSQFCIDPAYQGQGLGRRFHEKIVQLARTQGATTLALDTAQPAQALIAKYQALGLSARRPA